MSERLTDAQIAEIEARLAQATPGPWTPDSQACFVFAHDEQTMVCEIRGWGYLLTKHGSVKAVEKQTANAALIAHAPTDLAALLAEVRVLRVSDAQSCDIAEAERAFSARTRLEFEGAVAAEREACAQVLADRVEAHCGDVPIVCEPCSELRIAMSAIRARGAA